MIRIDNSCFLLFIEPPKWRKRLWAKNDETTQIMQVALNEARHGTSNFDKIDEYPHFWIGKYYKNNSEIKLKKRPIMHDFLLENCMITNSKAVCYLQYYRSSIPKSEYRKVKALIEFYKEKYKDQPEKLIPKKKKKMTKEMRREINRLLGGCELC